jgi:hypothetical protein
MVLRVRTCLALVLAAQLHGCTRPKTESPVPFTSAPKGDDSASGNQIPLEDTGSEPTPDMTQVPGLPEPSVHPGHAEVFFSRWLTTCAGHEWCLVLSAADLSSAAYYTKRVRVSDPVLVERLWADYITVKASKLEQPSGDCLDDARIMVVFRTSEPTLRWFAAGQGCPPPGGKVMMVTEGRWLHEKNGAVLRDMADAIGVTAQMETAAPDIFR